MPTPLNQSEITSAISKLDDWQLESGAIERRFEFDNFVKAMEFVNRIAGVAEDAGHHPDINIVYNHVTLRLSTHDAGGITLKDIRMAETIDELPELKSLEERRKAG